MYPQLTQHKQELKQSLLLLLDQLPQLKKNSEPVVLEFNYNKAVTLLSQLHYLDLYQIKASSAAPDIKSAAKKQIFKEWRRQLLQLGILFKKSTQ